MGRRRSGAQQAQPEKPYLPWLVAAAVAFFAALCARHLGLIGGETGAPANISSLGKVLWRTGQLMGEHNWKAALQIAQQHTDGTDGPSGDPQLLNIMGEVADGMQKRLGDGRVASRRVQLSGLGGPLGDALASAAWSERPEGAPFRFHAQFEAQHLPMPLRWPRDVADGEPTPEVTLLSARPMVLMVDNWLNRAANASLDRLPAEYDAAKASSMQPASTAQSLSTVTVPKLCFNKESTGFPQFAAVVTRCVEEAMAAEADGRPHCAATAALGRREGGPLSAFNTPGGQGSVCGPMTKALEEALVRSDNVLFDPGASDAVDTIDAAISAMLGFDFDVERVAVAAPKAVASFLKNASSTSARARAAVRDAYDFSTGPQLSRYRTARRGGYRLHTDCQ